VAPSVTRPCDRWQGYLAVARRTDELHGGQVDILSVTGARAHVVQHGARVGQRLGLEINTMLACTFIADSNRRRSKAYRV